MMRWMILVNIFISCGNPPGEADGLADTTKVAARQQAAPVGQPADPLKFRSCVPFDSVIVDGPDSLLKMALIRSFSGDMASVKPTQILAINLTKRAVVCGLLGVCQVYMVTLSMDLPEVVPDTMFLLVSRNKGQAALFPLSSLQPLRLSSQDTVTLIGGTFLSRGKGFFMIYRFNDRDGFDLVFDTSKDSGCPGPIPVYNSSLDCISYDPFGLKLELTDVNGDGINDLIFSGKVLFFCQGLETGYGRTDRKPLKEKSVRIVFQAAIERGRPSWKLQDTSMCRLLAGQ
jgi:hypothetical protein